MALTLFGQSLKPRDDFFELFDPLIELSPARVGDCERFARAIASLFGDQAFVGQQVERGINHPGAGGIIAARQLFDRFDQFIAVARRFGDQGQQDQPQLTRAKHPPASTWSTPMRAAASASAKFAAEVRAPVRTPTATEATNHHGQWPSSATLVAAAMHSHVISSFHDSSKIYLT